MKHKPGNHPMQKYTVGIHQEQIEMVEKALQLSREGHSNLSIGEQCGCSNSMVPKMVKRAMVVHRAREIEIGNTTLMDAATDSKLGWEALSRMVMSIDFPGSGKGMIR